MDLPSTAVFRDFDFKLPVVEKLMYRKGTSAPEFGLEAHLGQKGPAGIDRVLDFAETFLGGGTSSRTPLTATVELLEEFDEAIRARRHRDAHRRRLRRHRGMDARLEPR